jgi:hypothetical protein
MARPASSHEVEEKCSLAEVQNEPRKAVAPPIRLYRRRRRYCYKLLTIEKNQGRSNRYLAASTRFRAKSAGFHSSDTFACEGIRRACPGEQFYTDAARPSERCSPQASFWEIIAPKALSISAVLQCLARRSNLQLIGDLPAGGIPNYRKARPCSPLSNIAPRRSSILG